MKNSRWPQPRGILYVRLCFYTSLFHRCDQRNIILVYFSGRRCFSDVMEVMLHDDSSSSSDKDTEEALEILLLEMGFRDQRIFESRLHLEDLSEMFRYFT